MRRAIGFSLDFFTTFLQAVVAVLVVLGGAREPFFKKHSVIFFPRPAMRTKVGECLSMFVLQVLDREPISR